MASSQEPPLRVMSLHALAYCQRLFYLEEVEEIRVADDRGLCRPRAARLARGRRGRRAHRSSSWPTRRSGSSARSMRSAAATGRSCPTSTSAAGAGARTKVAEAWPSDRLQVIAYAALIESATGQPIAEGRVRYHADNVTVRVPIDDAARADLAEAIATARRLRESTERPPVAENERLCVRCSLAPVCLPEEVRQADDPDREPRPPLPARPRRHQPPRRHAGRLGRPQRRDAGRHAARRRPGRRSTPIREVDSRPAPRLRPGHDPGAEPLRRARRRRPLADHLGPPHRQPDGHRRPGPAPGPPVPRPGRRGDLPAPGQGPGPRQDRGPAPLPAPRLARRRRRPRRDAPRPGPAPLGPGVASTRPPTATRCAASRARPPSATSGAWPGCSRPTVPESLRYSTRTRRPPLDRFNALLGFGYGLLHTAVMRAILAAGLEPALGFFHTPRSAAYPLVLDLMELFRVPLWDMVLVGSLNRGQWDPDGRLRRHQGQGLALRRRPPQGDRPVRGAARRDLEAPGDRLLAVVRPRRWSWRPGCWRRSGAASPACSPGCGCADVGRHRVEVAARDERRQVVAGLLRCPRPGPAPPRREGPGGDGPADASTRSSAAG